MKRLSGYAPDLNPDEGIWPSLKRVELGNRCCATLGQLRHKRQVIQGCMRYAGYQV